MFRKLTLATAFILVATPTFAADTIGTQIATCVEKGAFRVIDGKQYHLRSTDDFRVVHNAVYNQYGVNWKKRIQADQGWAHAKKIARGCIDAATGGKVAKAKD